MINLKHEEAVNEVKERIMGDSKSNHSKKGPGPGGRREALILGSWQGFCWSRIIQLTIGCLFPQPILSLQLDCNTGEH